MSSKTIRTTIVCACVFVGFAGCSKPTEAPDNPLGSYVPLNVGDIAQTVSVDDSSTVLTRVLRTVKRSDSLEVFEVEITIGTLRPSIAYFGISGGYYVYTGLDSSSTYPGNPFAEMFNQVAYKISR